LLRDLVGSDAENGTISAVLDLNERELYISGVNGDIQAELLIPGAASLASLLKDRLTTSVQQIAPSLMNPFPSSPSVGKGKVWRNAYNLFNNIKQAPREIGRCMLSPSFRGTRVGLRKS
jgi:hypothetical protein